MRRYRGTTSFTRVAPLTRRICYVTGSRADFGLIASTLCAAHAERDLAVSIAVTGMHMDPAHGLTVRDVEASGLPISVMIRTPELDGTGFGMAAALSTMLLGLATAWHADRPDLVLVLGDRGEMLAGALAAAHLDIPVAHIHGGERSGTIDESLRHAISKLAHLHFVSNDASRVRLERMGERADRVWVTGAPGIAGLAALADRTRRALCAEVGLNALLPVALFCYHPVLQDGAHSDCAPQAAIAALHGRGIQVLAMTPNSDSGSTSIRTMLEERAASGEIVLLRHLARRDFASWMAHADLIVGNSSAGIIEAATFGTPVVNIGDRQKMRERNANVIDVGNDAASIDAGIARARGVGRVVGANVYGNDGASARIVHLLRTVDLTSDITRKCNAY